MGTWSGVTPKTWVDGTVPTAADVDEQMTDFSKGLSDGWVKTFTPEWRSTGTLPTLGSNGFHISYYSRIGRLVWGYGRLAVGSTGVAYGTGNYIITLPVAAAETGQILGPCWVWESGTAAFTGFLVGLDAGNPTHVQVRHESAGLAWTPTAPFSLASTPNQNDGIIYQYMYQAASA